MLRTNVRRECAESWELGRFLFMMGMGWHWRAGSTSAARAPAAPLPRNAAPRVMLRTNVRRECAESWELGGFLFMMGMGWHWRAGSPSGPVSYRTRLAQRGKHGRGRGVTAPAGPASWNQQIPFVPMEVPKDRDGARFLLPL